MISFKQRLAKIEEQAATVINCYEPKHVWLIGRDPKCPAEDHGRGIQGCICTYSYFCDMNKGFREEAKRGK